MQLSKSERILLDVLVEFMDETNHITNDALIRGKINNLLNKMGIKPYADRTFHNGFNKLVDTTLLLKKKGRGIYQVNPLYFFKGNETERQKAVRANLEEINKDPINKERRRILSKRPKH